MSTSGYSVRMDETRFLHALGSEIRAEAAARRIPLRTLAERAGIARSALYHYLDGQRDLPLSVLLRISDLIDMQPDVLMRRAEERARRDAQRSSQTEQVADGDGTTHR